MGIMNGSPVLTESRFEQEIAEARAGGADLDRHTMTIPGTITALGVLMVILFASGAYGWTQVIQTGPLVDRAGNDQLPSIPGWIFLAGLGGFALGLVTSFVPKIARITAPIYCVLFGMVLGAISAVYNYYQDGIVTQAVFATAGIFLAMLFLYTSRIIKVTNRFVMIVVGATMGIALMYLVTWIATLFGANIAFWREPTALGIAVSAGIVIIAALNLAIDFAFIEGASQQGAPKYMEWYGAFGVVLTLVWLYLEVLRLLSLLDRR